MNAGAREPHSTGTGGNVTAGNPEVAPGGTGATALWPADGILTQEAARRIALRENPDLHAAAARLEAARARVEQARSYYLPVVAASHNSTRTFHTPASRNRLSTALQMAPAVPADVTDSSGFALTTLLNAVRGSLFGSKYTQGETNSFAEHATGLTLSWTVYDGFARDARLLASRYARRASQYAVADARRLIVHAVDTAYFQVQLAQERWRIAQADETFSREQLELTEKLHEAGRATSADVNNFKVRMLAAQTQVAAAAGARAAGRVVLAELMGLDGVELPPGMNLSPLTPETEAELSTPAPGAWLGRALADRPDVQQLHELLRGLDQDVRATRSLFGPTVQASASWGFDRISSLRYRDDDQSSAAGFEVRWELYTGGRRQALLAAAEAARTEGQATLRQRKLAVESEVRRAIIDLQDAQTRIQLQRQSLHTAGENRRLIQAGFAAGKEPLTRLNEVQRDYTEAEAALATARIRLRQAWSDLRAAAGCDLSEPSREATLDPPPPTGQPAWAAESPGNPP